MTRRCKDGRIDTRYIKTGPRPDRWSTGPDPLLRRLRYKFLRARVQARYWCQPWEITWEEYQEIMWEVLSQHGRSLDSLNLARKDRNLGWHKDNVMLRPRKEIVNRPKRTDSNGKLIQRQRRQLPPKETE